MRASRWLRGISTRVSHIKGETDVPLLDKTITQQFDDVVATHGDRPFVHFPWQQLSKTWGELQAEATETAAGLLNLGYLPGDRIGVWLPNYYEWILMQFACHRAGVVLVNINPAYRVSELTHALNCVGCKGLLLTDQYKSSDYAALITAVAPELQGRPAGELVEVQSARVPQLQHLFSINAARVPGALPMEALKIQGRGGVVSRREADVNPDDIANIQFTSGTTGHPKPASLTHRNILNNGYMTGKNLGYTHRDVVCVPVPLYHCFGTVLGTLAVVTNGGALVFPSPGFDAALSLAAVERYKCTSLYGVPTMFIQMLHNESASHHDTQTLRTGIMAGSICPPEIMSRVISQFGMRDITICYGMTETSPVSWQTPVDAPMHLKCETVGTIHPHVECKVVDPNLRTVPRGTVGELLTRGYNVMKGYYNMPEATEQTMTDDGFIKTGDLASIDEEGYCRILGRKKDMIIRGGENVYPAEVEAFLHTHPDVQDVSVLGLPHAVFGEEVAAFIIPRPGAAIDLDAVREFSHNQISHFKVPSKVFSVDEFPLTATGKVQKYVLREQYMAKEAADA